MVTIDEVQSEVVIDGQDGGTATARGSHEARLEQLRPVLRALIAEEMERFLRTRVECS